ncbi:NAD(P)-dependent alcohol dehydrogenase [Mesobacterium pallidum]|uniref:NAD(P)-dependent alcohol dehydrogenase n=1 Tax=Mesobacterium pallidum TaxID=2872037 RepID=UPI001EE25E74|nr:NAD(P)-dependent alcohol dehydrogenase [Mesobacterium pallidum]
MPLTIRAAVTPAEGAPFDLRDVTLDDPRPDEILVRIAGVGLCHTDLVARDGGMRAAFPALFGHEGAGVVERVGAGVTKVTPGDHVVLTFNSCGQCPRCAALEPSYCVDRNAYNYAGRRPDGDALVTDAGAPIHANFFGQSSFATHAIANERNTVRIDKAMPLDLAGALGCGIQTGAGAVMRSLSCEAGSSIVIIGGGSVGLAAVIGARLQGCGPIIVIEPHAVRRDLARELGATHALAIGEEGQVRALMPLGVDYVLDTSGVPGAFAHAPDYLRSRGTFGFLGVPPMAQADAALPGSLRQVMGGGFTYRGIVEGDSDPDAFIPELVAHHLAGRLPIDRFTRVYPLSAINDAVHDQETGVCVKACLKP